MSADASELRRVYAQVAAMRQNLAEYPDEDDAARFHEQLDRLARAGYDVDEFRLNPDRDMFRRMTSSSRRTGATYAAKKDLNPGVLASKMDALLLLFKLEGDKTPIGFDAPRKR